MNEKKNILKSKTFWFNVLGIAAAYGNLLPPKYAVPVVTAGNIGLRLISEGAVTLGPSVPK